MGVRDGTRQKQKKNTVPSRATVCDAQNIRGNFLILNRRRGLYEGNWLSSEKTAFFISSYLCVDLLCDNQGNTILLLSHRRHLLPESEFVFLALFDKAEIKSYLFCFKS